MPDRAEWAEARRAGLPDRHQRRWSPATRGTGRDTDAKARDMCVECDEIDFETYVLNNPFRPNPHGPVLVPSDLAPCPAGNHVDEVFDRHGFNICGICGEVTCFSPSWLKEGVFSEETAERAYEIAAELLDDGWRLVTSPD